MTTRTCPDCGDVLLDPEEQFCGNCGCYLDWNAAPEAEAEPVPETTPAGPPESPGFTQRVRSALGVGDDADHPAAPGPAAVVPAPGPPPATPPPPQQAPPPPAQRLVVPPQPTPQQPAPQQPRARQPGAAAPAAPRRTAAPPEALQPGDLVCGSCGIGNRPSRKFCRRCGQTLAEAQVAKIPFWRRLLPRRTPKVTEAGARPKTRGGAGAGVGRPRVPTRLITLVAVLAALGVGTYLLRSSITDGLGIVQDRVAGDERIVPDKVVASSAQRGHPADLVRDGATNKYWAPADPGDGTGQYVEAQFADPVRLVYVIVTPGVTTSDEELFQQQGRPHEIRLEIVHEDGTRDVETVEVPDQRGAAQFGIHESDVTAIRFVLVSAFAGTAKGSRTAIGEIEFRIRT